MKIVSGFVVTLLLLTFAVAPSRVLAIPPPPPSFYPTLVSPKAGQVLYPGQKIRVEWQRPGANLVKWPSYCEIELWLSLDGGQTFTIPVTPSMDPNGTFFYWTVPNTPTNSAVFDIRFGCEPFYPEGFHPQTAAPFVIANAGGRQN